jgi:hypothetical protein
VHSAHVTRPLVAYSAPQGQWLDHVFRPFSFAVDGALVRTDTQQLSLCFKERVRPFRLLTAAMLRDNNIEDLCTTMWEPVVVMSKVDERDHVSLRGTEPDAGVASCDDDDNAVVRILTGLASIATKFTRFQHSVSPSLNAFASRCSLRALNNHVPPKRVYELFVLDECFAGGESCGILLMLVALRMWATSIGGGGNGMQLASFGAAAINLTNLVGFEFDSAVIIDKNGKRQHGRV